MRYGLSRSHVDPASTQPVGIQSESQHVRTYVLDGYNALIIPMLRMVDILVDMTKCLELPNRLWLGLCKPDKSEADCDHWKFWCGYHEVPEIDHDQIIPEQNNRWLRRAASA